jgi:hypothetical protein
MKINRVSELHPTASAPLSPSDEGGKTGLVRAWSAFWFTPVNPIGLHAIRVLFGLLFLVWLLSFWGWQEAFFGLGGFVDRQALREAAQLGPEADLPVPIPMWSVLYLAGRNAALLNGLYFLALGVAALFTLGLWTRVTSVLMWVFVTSFLANPVIGYDADALLVIVSIYLMVGYVLLGQWSRPQTLAGRLLGNYDTFLFAPRRKDDATRPVASHAANLALRLLQVHFAVVVVASGLHKLQFGTYWGGVAYWFPLNPPLEVTAESVRRQAEGISTFLFIISLAQYLVLAWQIGFPAFAWRPRWRLVLLGGAAVGWAGSVFLYRLPLFGPLYVLCSLGYLTPSEWQWIHSRGRGILNVIRAPRTEAPEKTTKARPQRLKTH